MHDLLARREEKGERHGVAGGLARGKRKEDKKGKGMTRLAGSVGKKERKRKEGRMRCDWLVGEEKMERRRERKVHLVRLAGWQGEDCNRSKGGRGCDSCGYDLSAGRRRGTTA